MPDSSLRPRPASALLLVLPLLACPAGAGDGDELGSEAGDEAETGEPIPACECIPEYSQAELEAQLDPTLPQCGVTTCPTVVQSEDEDGVLVIADPAALECTLQALRDRTPGLLSWTSSDASGKFTKDGYVLIAADGRAVRRRWTRDDDAFGVSEAQLGELAAPAIFHGCLAQGDVAGFTCLIATELSSVDAICDEGRDNGAI